MTAFWLVLCAGASAFALVEALFWRRRAKLAKTEFALRARLGVEDDDAGIFRTTPKREAAARAAHILEQAGISWSPTGLLYRVLFLGCGLATGGGMILGMPGFVLGLLLSPVLFYLHLLQAADRRRERIAKQMPRALQLLILTLRAGHSLPRAVALVAAELPAPIAQELTRVADEHGLGRPLEDAFVAMSRRLEGCLPVRLLVTSILVLRQTGGNLIEVLERVVETLNAQEAYRLKLRAATAEGRTSALIVAMTPLIFGVIATIFRPEQMQTFVLDPIGKKLLWVAFAFWAAGAYWVVRLVRSNV